VKKLVLVILVFLCSPKVAQSQHMSGIASKWSDSFVAWEIFGLENVSEDSTEAQWEEFTMGSLQQRWLDVREDWTEWDFSLFEREGTIKIKWKTDPSQWELRTFDGSIITMKTVWRDDFTEWRVTDGTVSLDFKSRYTSDLGEWFAKDREGNRFAVTVTYPNDPRDWTITDELPESVSAEMKLAMVFVVLYHATPHR